MSTGCARPPGAPSSGGPILYPGPPQQPRVQYLTKFTEARDVEGSPNLLMSFLVGDQQGQRKLRKPTGLAASDGIIYVADPGWDGVLVLDLAERRLGHLGSRGDGKLEVPVAIALDSAGHKFVADSRRKQVVEFDAEHKYVKAFGDPSELRAVGVAVDDQHVYVSNRDLHRVEVYDRKSGRQTRVIGEWGRGDGQFNVPTSLILDSRGHLFVTDVGNFRIQEFDPKGRHLGSYGFAGDHPGTFARPRGIGIDRDGHLYTVDGAFENVQIWDTSNRQVLLAFGGPGVGPGDMYLPGDVHVSYELVPHFEHLVDSDLALQYVILVANNYGPNKLAVYGFVEPRLAASRSPTAGGN